MHICVDASFVVRLLTCGEASAGVVQLWRQWHTEKHRLIAPALLRYEITNALHRYAVGGYLKPEAVMNLVREALALPIEIQTHADQHLRALALARTYHLPATYDAHYLAVAEAAKADLWTCDTRLYQAVAAPLPWVHLAPST